MRSLIRCVFVAALLVACNDPPVLDPMPVYSPSPEVPGVVTVEGTPFPIDRLSSIDDYVRYHSGLNEPARVVIRTEQEWTALWDQMLNNFHPKPAMPVVDFSQHMLVVAAMGAQPTGGYGIRIENVSRRNAVITATVRLTSPGARCFTSQALTQPADIVRMPRSELPVHFVDASSVHEC